MSTKTYLLFCEFCSYKRLTDGTDAKDLVEVKTSPMMTSVPVLDSLTNRTVPAKFKNQKRRFKCPKCGRIIFPRKFNESNNAVGREAGNEGSEVQGTPPI